MRYLKYILILVVSFLIIDRAFYFFIVKSESRIYGESKYFHVLKKILKKGEVDTLILGTSRTRDAIHPAHIKRAFGRKVFREADCGRGPMYNYHYYKKYREIAGKPDIVIYGIDYFVFNLASNKHIMARFPAICSNKLNVKGAFSSFSLLYSNKNWDDQFTGNLITEMKNRIVECYKNRTEEAILSEQKYLGVPSDMSKLIRVKPDKMKECKYRRFPGEEGIWFRKLLREFRNDGVEVLLVILPDYYGTWVTNCEKRLMVEEMRRITGEYNNVYLYNYNVPELFPIKNCKFFRDGGFGNPNSHLSARGAEYLFENLLKKDLKRIYHEEKNR